MKIEEFKLERIMSVWQHQVKYDLTETGVNPMFLKELISKDEFEELYSSLQLRYIQTNGTIPLKERISAMYNGSDIENILVTNGSAEANFIAIWSQIEPGDEIVYMLPNYMQIWGLARAFGADIKAFSLREENNWKLDVSDLKKAITEKTKFIIICNPNNPTGSVLTEEAMDEIVEQADKAGAWILSDEVYRGAELNGIESPSFWEKYDKVLVSSGLSKAHALPGLRIGWLLGPKEIISRAWTYHDYTTITTGTINDRLARIALEPVARQKILNRNRDISNTNIVVFKEWLSNFPNIFHFVPPEAGGFAFVGYDIDINSTKLAMDLIQKKSVFIVPGDCFGMDHFFRINYGAEKKFLSAALHLIKEMLEEIS
ncbi:MAG: aminotransferase class I/II-fold pyridoxal phosphate-dependent enzyme, partial [Candidatus Aminicenantes bacterium]|nr:aminotransferase class I/II-fold pyridoxal phosphate-dependent enzyme [Candidatus Aminicenantes bacterium]